MKKTAKIAGYMAVSLVCPHCDMALENPYNSSNLFCEEDFAENAPKSVVCECGAEVQLPKNPFERKRRKAA